MGRRYLLDTRIMRLGPGASCRGLREKRVLLVACDRCPMTGYEIKDIYDSEALRWQSITRILS